MSRRGIVRRTDGTPGRPSMAELAENLPELEAAQTAELDTARRVAALQVQRKAVRNDLLLVEYYQKLLASAGKAIAILEEHLRSESSDTQWRAAKTILDKVQALPVVRYEPEKGSVTYQVTQSLTIRQLLERGVLDTQQLPALREVAREMVRQEES